jgi:hypothetical protein
VLQERRVLQHGHQRVAGHLRATTTA